MTFDPISDDPGDYDSQYPAAMVDVAIDSAGDAMLGVLYLAQGAGPHPAVVLLHGFPGNERNFDLAQILRRAGWNVLVFHYRGSWGSAGDFAFANVLADTGAAVDFLMKNRAEYRIDPARLVLIGHSMGGWAALMVAASDARVMAVGAIAAWNPGLVAEMVAEYAEAQAGILAFFEASLGPLRGTTAQKLLDEILAQGDSWHLSGQASALAQRPALLVAGSRDNDLPAVMYHLPLVNAFRQANATQLSEVTLDSDHVFSDRRIALARTLLDWLNTLE